MYAVGGKETIFNKTKKRPVIFLALFKQFALCRDARCTSRRSPATGVCNGCGALCCDFCTGGDRTSKCSHYGRSGHIISTIPPHLCAHGVANDGSDSELPAEAAAAKELQAEAAAAEEPQAEAAAAEEPVPVMEVIQTIPPQAEVTNPLFVLATALSDPRGVVGVAGGVAGVVAGALQDSETDIGKQEAPAGSTGTKSGKVDDAWCSSTLCELCSMQIVSVLAVEVFQPIMTDSQGADAEHAAAEQGDTCIHVCEWNAFEPWAGSSIDGQLLRVLRQIRRVHDPSATIYMNKFSWRGQLVDGGDRWQEASPALSAEHPMTVCFQESDVEDLPPNQITNTTVDVEALIKVLKVPNRVAASAYWELPAASTVNNRSCHHCGTSDESADVSSLWWDCGSDQCENLTCSNCMPRPAEDALCLECLGVPCHSTACGVVACRKMKLKQARVDAEAMVQGSELSELVGLLRHSERVVRDSVTSRLNKLSASELQQVVACY